MPKLLSGQVLRDNGSGQYISLPGAQPALGVTPSTSSGFTLITLPNGVTNYSNILGNLAFSSGSITNTVAGEDISINSYGGAGFNIHAPTTFFDTVQFSSTFTFTDLYASGEVRFSAGSSSTSITSGTLVVTGGAGISGDLYIGKGLNVSGSGAVTLTPSGKNVTISPIAGGTVIIAPTTLGSINNVEIGDSTPSTGRFTSLTAQTASLLNGTDSSSTSTGALVVAGGVGVGNSLYATSIFDDGKRTITEIDYGVGLDGTSFGPTVVMSNTGVLSLTAGTGTNVSSTTGNIVVWTYGNTLQAVTEQGNQTTVAVEFNNLTNSTASNTGSVIIRGGLGVAKDVFIDGNIYASNLTPSDIYVNTVHANVGFFTTTNISSELYSTATLANNALFVTGGVGIQSGLTVGADAYIYGNLTVLGTFTTQITSVADVGRKVVALSTSAGPAILAIDSGITVGPIASPFVKFFFDGVSSWKSTGNIIPASSVHDLGSLGYQWGSVYSNNVIVSSTVQPTNTSTGALQVTGGVGIGGNVYAGGTVRLINKSVSTSTTTGALTVSGGVGIGGALNVSGNARILNTTNSTGTNTGALVVSGGLGVAGDIYASNFLFPNGDRIITTASIVNFTVVAMYGGTDTAVSSSSGIISVWNTSTLQSITDRGAVTNNVLELTNETNAANSTTGALIVSGGVGIKKDLYVGGNITVYGDTVFNGTVTNVLSTNTVYTDNIIELHKSSANAWTVNDGKDIGIRMHYYSGSSNNAFFGRSNNSGYLEWFGSGVETNGTTFTGVYGTFKTGVIRLSAGINSTGVNSGTLIVSGGAGISGNLYAGYVYSNGSQVVTAATLGNYGVSIIHAGTGTAISTSTGEITFWSTATLQEVTNNGNVTTQQIYIVNTTSSKSTTTGALVVSGGIAVGDELHVSGDIYGNNLYLNGTANIASLSVSSLDVSDNVQILSDVDNTSTFFVKNINSGTNASGGYAIENDIGNRLELTLSSSNRSFGNYGTGSAYLNLSEGIDSFVIGDNAEIKFFTQGSNSLYAPTLTLGQDGLSTFVDSIKITDNRFDPSPKATLQLESNARVGYSNINLCNTSLDGQDWTIEVGGANYAGQDGLAINEGNFTIRDNVAEEYRLVLTKTTGNLLVGYDVDDGENRLQVNGSANFANAISATTGSFVDLVISGQSSFDVDLEVLGNLTAHQSLDVKSTSTFENIISVAGTATFSETVIVGSSALETAVTPINTTNPTLIGTFDASLYRSARCVVQITDSDFFHLSEIVLLHDNYGQVHKSEYGIISTNGPLGEFTAYLEIGQVNLYFTAYNATTKTANVVQTMVSV